MCSWFLSVVMEVSKMKQTDIEYIGMNQTTPRIAISQDRIMVASQGDSGSSSNNFIHSFIYTRYTGKCHRRWIDLGTRYCNRQQMVTQYCWCFRWVLDGCSNCQRYILSDNWPQAFDLDGNPKNQAHWVGPDSYAVFPNIDAKDDKYIVVKGSEDIAQYTRGRPRRSL